MASWYLAKSLVNLRNELNAKYPKRDKTSDGSIGDRAHRSRVSDHNPTSSGLVRAIDVDRDGINTSYVISQMKKHPATQYIIFNRTIYSRSDGFRARRYYGSNPHTMHIHISIRHASSAYNSTAKWLTTSAPKPVTPAPSVPKFPGILKEGSRGSAVKALQARLNKRGYTPKLKEDGLFGSATERNLKAFQKFARIRQDGIYGPVSHKLIYTLKIT